MRSGDFRRAESEYRRLLEQSPQSAELLSNLGIALQMQGKSSAAIQAWEGALKLKWMPRTYALVAEEKCKTRDLDGARPMVARIFRQHPWTPSITALIAPCFLELDEPIESVQAYESLASYPAYPDDLRLIQLSKSYLQAMKFFIVRLAKAPASEAYIIAIHQARNTGSGNARGAFEAAAKASPNFSADLDFMGAVARWREHPEDPALLYLLTVLSSEQSMRQVQICGEKYSDSPYYIQLQAEMLVNQDREPEAVALYERLMQEHPELPELFYDLGMLFRKQKEWAKALGAFRQQLEKDPDDERTAARVSEALIQLERWGELSEFLTPRIRAANPPLWALLDDAEASQNLDKPEEAIRTLIIAERVYPDDASVHYRLMHLYRLARKPGDVQRELMLFRAASK